MADKKLKICFLGTAAGSHTLKWVQYFADKGHEVHLISYEPLLKDYDLGDIKLHFLKKIIPIQTWPFNTLFNLPFNLFKVKKLIKKINPDIINAHYVIGYGTLSSILSFHPLVITAWGSDILVTPKKFLPSKWTVKYALNKADLITCDAKHMKETVIKLGVNPSKIKIINFGIDVKKFNPGPEDEKLKEKLRVSGSKIVISLRNLCPIYDIEALIRAVPLVLRKIPDTKFIIVGGGPQEKDLKELVRKLNIENHIKFIGFISNDELPKYLRISDVYVSTSLSDSGIAASTAEAMACVLPVVITDVADNKEWVKDGEGGFLIPLKSPQILAEKIIYLLKNENICKKLGQKGRKTIEERNDYYKEMAKMEEIYYQLANKKHI